MIAGKEEFDGGAGCDTVDTEAGDGGASCDTVDTEAGDGGAGCDTVDTEAGDAVPVAVTYIEAGHQPFQVGPTFQLDGNAERRFCAVP